MKPDLVQQNRMTGKQTMYFIAILPSGDVSDELDGFKHDFANRFNSRAALRIQPHITLKAPFHLPAAKQPELAEWFGQLDFPVPVFNQELRDFGFFPRARKPVVFVQPVLNPSLTAVQKHILFRIKDAFPSLAPGEYELAFHPHITIAYRDLQPAMFRAAWEEYGSKRYDALFKVDRVTLLRHEGEKWQVLIQTALKQER